MVRRVSHVGVVVSNLDEALKLYEKVFGLRPTVVKEAMGGKVRAAFVPVGDGEIELLQPKDPEIALGKFLRTHGNGIHHISLSTDDIDSEVEKMKAGGAAFAEEPPKVGAHGVRIIFTKPETTGGIAFEICEEK